MNRSALLPILGLASILACSQDKDDDDGVDAIPSAGLLQPVRESFSGDRIINISAQEYVDSRGKELSSYELKGIHSNAYFTGRTCIELLVEKAGNLTPPAEVIVN